MPEAVIKAENLGKKYRINPTHSGDFRNTFGNLFSKRNARSSGNSLERDRGETDRGEFWALKDINFEIKKGEAVGIIGRNGAGKSTLLKILSRITHPTTGRFTIEGRVSSLLEVGTGFHMELTGRENIFLNGTILGMNRKEIRQKFDEIVAFSGVEKFIDTPVKHYSSGMQVRLAFSVAAHLEPEILIVDEVLAVGDAEFQKKCLGKMEDVTGQGRTVLFVSHNMPSLISLCSSGIWLDSGELVHRGPAEETINSYLNAHLARQKITDGIRYFQPVIKITGVSVNGTDENYVRIQDEKMKITIDIELSKKTTFEMDVHIKNFDVPVASYSNFVKNNVKLYEPGKYRILYSIDLSDIKSGNYKMDLYFTEPFISWYAVIENGINLDVNNTSHHTFINTPTLKWGSTILNGSCEILAR